MIYPYVGDLDLINTLLEPEGGITHLLNQIEDFRICGLMLGAVAGIPLMGEVMCSQKSANQSVGPLGLGLEVMLFNAENKIKRLQVLCFPPGHRATLSRPV